MDIAVEVLAERGYRGASMLEIANRASASKETLYAWFGDKPGLFEQVIRRNARAVQAALAPRLENDTTAESVLVAFGQALLRLLLGEDAVAINRAAISEAASDSRLAQVLASAGREATLPDFIRFLEGHSRNGTWQIDTPSEAAEDFLGLLIGDSQIRRLLGLLPAPGEAEILARANRAAARFSRLYAP
ncbi:MAG: TetR/AcrR family transcriptional regulator [Alphaproteobacteria bacterium]|jgi:AcrR family transcriptional regulator|nr:TetR/AcrR family transcriptional regulator [Alphaproteobacteria bacterium]